MIKIESLFAIGLGLCTVAMSAAATEWLPQRPIKVIVPYGPGGSADHVMRLLAEGMGKQLGQPVIVENKPGAGTVLGATLAANAPADGYTLLLATSTTLSIAPIVQKKLQYSPRQFMPVASLQTLPFMLDVNKDLPVKSLQELAAYARGRPGQLNYGTLGNGSSNHVLGALFSRAAGDALTPIHYNSGAPAMMGLMRGDIHVYFDGIPTSIARSASGDIRGLAITAHERVSAAPNIPTVYEAGFPDLGLTIWYGLVAPVGTPEAVVSKINSVVNVMLDDPAIMATMARDGTIPAKLDPKQFGALIQEDSAAWKKAFDSLGIKLE